MVGGVDYKGVREIMKNCIEKAQTLPTHLHLSVRPQAEALTDVLAYIFNREEIWRNDSETSIIRKVLKRPLYSIYKLVIV